MNHLASIMTSPWALDSESMANVREIYSRHIRGEVADLPAIAAKLGRPIVANNNSSIMSIIQGVAVIRIEGVLVQKGNMFSDVSGATSMQIIDNCFNQAVSDPAVKGVVLHISSGGGQVAGTSELSDTIFRARSSKRIVCYTDSMLCSAALWIGSAAHSVLQSSETCNIGSVGVVSGHVDRSGAEAMKGTKTTEVSSGKFKRITSQYEPLTTEGRAEIQAQVNFLYGVFVDAVARNRGISTKKVKDSEARIYLGSQAISAGFADGFSTLPAIIASMQTPVQRGAGAQAATKPIQPIYITDAVVARMKALQATATPPVTSTEPSKESTERQAAILAIATGGSHGQAITQ